MSAVPSPHWPRPAACGPQWLDQRLNNGRTFGSLIQLTNRNVREAGRVESVGV